MGNFEKTLSVKIKAFSGASEADMSQYGEELSENIKSYIEGLKYKSFYSEVFTGWEESYKVDLEISIS